MLESLILHWGYVAVGIGTFLEGETILLAAAAFSHRGLLSPQLVVLVAFLGSFVGDQVWFYVGRYFGRALIERRKGWKAAANRAERWLSRRGSWFVLGFRFIYGIRLVTPVFLGASSYPALRFFVLNAIGGALWAIAFGALGWALGASLHTLLSRTAHVEELAGLMVVVAIAMWLGGHWLRKRSTPQHAG